MRKAYKIEVDCANCANHIENEIQKLTGINSATVSFLTQKMKIDFAPDADVEAVIKDVLVCARKIEPDFCILT